MDTELLKTFLEVKNTRHFGKAAENLYLTQAAVSARIKQLENILGGPLFTRFRNNLQLTITGERLIPHAETILLAWDRAQQDVALKKKQKQVFAMGATSGLWDMILQQTLSLVHASHPELALRAEALSQPALVRHLMERTLDFALLFEPAKLAELVSEPVVPADLVLVSSKPDQRVEEAINRRFVSVNWGISFQISYSQHFPDTAPPVLHTTLARIALEFILEHGGSAYLPHQMVERLLGSTLHLVNGAPVISRQVFACYHKDNTRTQEIDMVLSAIQGIHRPVEMTERLINV